MFDDDIREFPSPLGQPSPLASAVTLPKPIVASISAPGDRHDQAINDVMQVLRRDPDFARAVATLAKLPDRKRHGLASFVRFCLQRTGEERAKFVLWQEPGLSDGEVAEVIGVCRETIVAWEGYRLFRDRLRPEGPRPASKFRGRARRPIYESDEMED